MPQDAPELPEGDRHRSETGSRRLRASMRSHRVDLEHQVQATRAQIDATNERIRERTGRNLVLAILIGLVLGGALVVSLLVLKELFILFGGTLLTFAAFELAQALRKSGRRVPRVATIVATASVMPAAYYWGAQGAWLVLLAGVALVTLWRLAESLFSPEARHRGGLGRDLAAGVFVQCYVTLLGSFAILLTAHDGGEWWTLAFLIVVVATDTGAYASGLAFGRHPMAPSISPKKTWEGFAGALVASVVAGIVLSLFMIGQPWWFGLVLGLTILVTATVGDLAESIIKRDLGVKDMSSWLPGHGGFLDRLDSILPSAALAYALFLLAGHGL